MIKNSGHINNKQSAFTIVELLIVIVIIGILAALVIVAYRGIQQRAQNNSRITSAKELAKLAAAYIAQEGSYPVASGTPCIGAGYVDWDGDSSLDCNRSGNAQHPSSTLDANLLKVTNKIPSVFVDTVDRASEKYGGYVLNAGVTIDGEAGRSSIQWWLDGTNQNCGVPGILSSGSLTTVGAINADPNYAGNNVTLCRMALPKP